MSHLALPLFFLYFFCHFLVSLKPCHFKKSTGYAASLPPEKELEMQARRLGLEHFHTTPKGFTGTPNLDKVLFSKNTKCVE
jgi:hypothetical protein